jgi:phenylacetate-CoA ligase
VEGAEPHYQMILERSEEGMDMLELRVEVSDKIFGDEMKSLVEMEKQIRNKIMQDFSIPVRVKLVEPKSLQRSLTKSSRVVDKRNV